ncbi:MAG: anhydro-N-acetylmuramic acid kinase [Deinococcales bacterium]
MSASRDLPPMVVLGLMSGTSLDGVDTVTVRLERRRGRLVWEVLARDAHPYPEALRARLRRAMDPERSSVVLLTELHQEVGRVYAEAVAKAAERHPLELAALSGQTVYHIPRSEPERGWSVVSTLQLGEASVVTEHCSVTTVSDFRQGDLAAGGQGAPMVSFADLQLYQRPGARVAVQNIGGIANLTVLPADARPEAVLAFDTGPGNCLIDEAMEAAFGRAYDEGGRVAASGRVLEDALARLLDEPYFALPAPKTTGRELFTLPWALERGGLEGAAPEDLVATLTALSAASIAEAYRREVLPSGLDEVLVAGGGARNATLLRMLRERLPVPLRSFRDAGYEDKDRETLAMAVMGYMAVHGEPNVLPAATGARHPVVAGKVCRPWIG